MNCGLYDVSKSYGDRQVLKAFTFEAEEGEAYVLTGPSGSGKTTVLRLLTGLEPPDEGRAVPASFAGVVFQEERFREDVSALENIRMVLPESLFGRAAREENKKKIRTALNELLPPEAADKPVRELSGGMRRRAAIVRAVMSPAPVLIFDEAFAGLDAESRKEAAAFIERHREGRTLIAASHFPEDLPFCRRVSVGYLHFQGDSLR